MCPTLCLLLTQRLPLLESDCSMTLPYPIQETNPPPALVQYLFLLLFFFFFWLRWFFVVVLRLLIAAHGLNCLHHVGS